MDTLIQLITAHQVIAYFVIANLIGLTLMAFDKIFAKAKLPRIPEKTFYILGFLGGFLGIWIGVFTFRHKTQKDAFLGPLGLATLLSILALIFLFKRIL